MKVAVVQFRASESKETNLKKILDHISEASEQNARLVAFPEFMMFYTKASQTPRQLASMSETTDGEFVSEISRAARNHRIQVVGSFYESTGKNNRVFDTSFVINGSGRLVSTYRKIHLYDALGFRESDKLMPGSAIAPPVSTVLGKMGMMICYDLRFPEMSRMLATAGSEILAAPSAWVAGDMKEEHWLVINRARAIENGCHVIAPDQVGNIYCGRSLVVDPFGRILLDMKKRQGIGYAEIDPGKTRRVRKALPLLDHRRPDVYANLL